MLLIYSLLTMGAGFAVCGIIFALMGRAESRRHSPASLSSLS